METVVARSRHTDGKARARLPPATRAERRPVTVVVLERRHRAVPVGIAGRHPPAAGLLQSQDHVVVKRAVKGEDEHVLLGRRRGRVTARVVDELKVSDGPPPAHHEEEVTALSVRPEPAENLEAQAIDPESLGGSHRALDRLAGHGVA